MKLKIGFSEVGVGMGLGIGLAVSPPISGHLSPACAQFVKATRVQSSALWFYVHRVHMLKNLENHPNGAILEWLKMFQELG